MTAEIEKPIKFIATYSRVSTSHQEEQQTIQNQLNALKEFAEKNNYTIVENYIDDGWSGDILARPSLDKLRNDAKNKIWDGVLIYDPDRLARRYSYQELVMDELREAGIEIIFITVSAPKNSEEKILHGVRGLFAEYERAKIAERFRLGKLRKAKEGHIMTTKPLYGYNYIPKQGNRHGYYEINPTEARVVKMIFSWVANDGMTLRGIIKKLQQLGVKPRYSKKGVWSTSTLTTMLRHRAYIGEAHWGSSYAVVPEKPLKHEKYRKIKKTSRRMRPREEWIIIPVPPILESKLFEKASRQLKSNFALCQRNKRNEYLLAGKIECVCGRKRGGEGYYNKPNLYYRCTDRTLNFPLPPKCEEGGINARVTDELVWEKVSGLMSSPELLIEQVNRWLNSKQTKAKSALVDVEALKKEIEKLNEQVDRYSKGYGASIFTLEQLKDYTDPLRKRIDALKMQVATATSEANQTQLETPSKSEVEAFAEKAKRTLQNLKFETKRAIILNTVEKVIASKEHLRVIGYLPLNVSLCYESRNRGSAECGKVYPIQSPDKKPSGYRQLSVLHY